MMFPDIETKGPLITKICPIKYDSEFKDVMLNVLTKEKTTRSDF